MAEGAAQKIVNAIRTSLSQSEGDPLDANVKFTYGLPSELENTHRSENEISIFLYDVHEDLSARHGDVRNYDAVGKRFAAGSVRLNYCFLITHWGPQVKAFGAETMQGKSLTLADFIVRRLINLRELTDIAGSYCRVLPPSEGLSSLGSFWQALGNRPRLCLGYTVTVPIRLDSKKEGEIGMVRPF